MKTGTFTDSEIIQGMLQQRNDVIHYLYATNYRSVRNHIEKNNGSIIDAEDIFQDAIIVLFHKVRNNELTLTSSVHTYLFGVVKILWLRHLEKNKKHTFEAITDVMEKESFFDDLLKLERKKIFLYHFKELPQGCQKLINLFIRHCPIQEITTIMGFGTDQYTRNKRLRCKKSLLEKITLDPYFKNTTNERFGKNSALPRQ